MLIEPDIAPAATRAILGAAARAAAAIPPAFPLAATVAVNPFLGQSGEDLATASARLSRVAGVRPFLPRADRRRQIAAGEIGEADLAEALAASPHPGKPADLPALAAAIAADPAPSPALPTVADLLAERDGTDWPALVARMIGLWAAGHFDRGQALWTPAPGLGAFAAWRAFASHDLTPEIFGLAGFCAHVAAAPDTAERAILRAADRLGLSERAAETAFHRLLCDLGGWAQHARYLGWQAELAGGRDDTLVELLAIRLVIEEALLARGGEALAGPWARTVAAHAEPVAPAPDDILDAILQEAADRAFQRGLAARLAAAADARAAALPAPPAPWMAAVFCIDVRSEPFRRALEGLDSGVETRGFAGFFGLPLAHREPGSTEADAHLPVLLAPGLSSEPALDPPAEARLFIAARARRAWGRFRQAAVSSFAFVEAAGVAYAGKLLAGSLGRTAPTAPAPAPRPAVPLTREARVETAAAVLGAMSWQTGWPPLVLLLGHGASVTNNPHESAYHCGACGGHTGEASAQLLAALLNDPETRVGLAARGLALPADTLFVGGLHDTTTDGVTLFASDAGPARREDIGRARDLLARAGALARAERAQRLPGARAATLAHRARDLDEVRPEWGMAGCA
ncbi:MAG: putative inorganic carbon transporter subunit DabA, partial [Sphingomonadaceae bacterium]